MIIVIERISKLKVIRSCLAAAGESDDFIFLLLAESSSHFSLNDQSEGKKLVISFLSYLDTQKILTNSYFYQ